MSYPQAVNPRMSALSSASVSSEHFSPASSTTRFSFPNVTPANAVAIGKVRPNVYERHLNKTRTAEVSLSAFAFLFSEIVQYTQKRVNGISDLERRLNVLGYRIGTRVLELMTWRTEAQTKAPKREIRFLPALMSIHTQVWRAVFGKPADAIEKSVEHDDEYMIIDNDPPITRFISVPRDMNQLSCSSLTAGIVEAVLDGLGFPGRVTAHSTPTDAYPARTTILIKLERSAVEREEAFNQVATVVLHDQIKLVSTTMATLHRLQISPPLMNSSCAWASDEKQLHELYSCKYTGAVTTRTATLNGFAEDYPARHTVAFSAESISSVNSYGYSPHPLAQYLSWIESLLQTKGATKPIIISVTSSSPSELKKMIEAIQQVRQKLGDVDGESSKIGIELNTSCPNIARAPPPSYTPATLSPLLAVLAMAYWSDRTLTIGLKLPPYTYATQFTDMHALIAGLSRDIDGNRCNPIAFLSCTNTLGSSLLFAEQSFSTTEPDTKLSERDPLFALPTPLGGLAGEAIHALALGNVYSFNQLLTNSSDVALRRIAIVGIGGVTTPAAISRMRNAGAKVVACATLLGREGVRAFELLSQAPDVQ